jgi:hypothetical protein
MRNSRGVDVLPCSDFVRTPVGAPWSGFWSANGVGGNGNQSSNGDLDTPLSSGTPATQWDGDGLEILRFLRLLA